MKKLYRLLFVLFFVVTGLNQSAIASHISGVDFSYECVGQDSFLVTFNIFRDCSGISVSSSQSVSFNSTCGGSFSTQLTLQAGSPTEVSQLCPTMLSSSTCNGGSLPGMEQYTFSGIVVLSPPCDTWTMSWSSCCRNPGIINVVNPNSQGMYISATLNSGTDSCNNSPVFNAQPIPYVCLNQVVNYNFAVTEPDGDSIVYSFISPMSGTTTPLPFSAGYTFLQPIPGITLNPATGQLTFTPTQVGMFVLAVQACEYEYGTGALLGCVTRDIQFVVINCSNTQPDPSSSNITNFQGTGIQVGPDSVEVCVSNWFSFDLSFSDPDTSDSVTLFTDIANVLPGATFTVTNGNPATITVSWTAQPGAPPFNSFTVTAVDDACPTPGIVTRSYNIIVVPSTYAGADKTICQGTQWAQMGVTGGSQFVWTVLSGSPIDTVQTSPTYNATCQNCQFPKFSPNVTTTYMVTSNLSSTCSNMDTVVVYVAPNFNLIMPNDTLICSIDSYPLSISTDEPTFTYTYQWSPSATLDYDTVQIPLANPVDPTTYTVTVSSAGGCVKTGSVFIDLSPPFPGNMQILGDTVLCLGSQTQLDIDFGTVSVGSCGPTTQSCLGVVQNGDVGNGTQVNGSTSYPAVYGGDDPAAKHQILYTASDLNQMGMTGGGLINSVAWYINTLSTVPAYTDFEIKIACTSEPDLSGGWVGSANFTSVYYSPGYVPSVGWNVHTFSTPYKWDGLSNILIEVCFTNLASGSNAIMPYDATGYQSVVYQVGSGAGICSSYSQFAAQISNKRPNTRFNFCSGVDANALTYAWSPIAGLSNASIPNPVAGPMVGTTYQVIVSDTFGGCSDTLTHFIDVVTKFDAGFSFNDPYCVSATPDTLWPNVGGGYFTGPGVDSSGVFDPGLAGVGQHNITYTIPQPSFCMNDSTMTIQVIDLPDASLANAEICVGGGTITLVPTTPGGVFSGPNIIDSLNGIFDATGLLAGNYSIIYTLTQPCYNSDTNTVRVIEPYSFSFNQNVVEVCQDDVLDLSNNYTLSSDPNQGSGPVIAIWSDTNNYIDSLTGVFDATGLAPGDYTVMLSILGVDSTCGTTSAMTVRVLKIDYPAFPSDLTFCNNEKKAIIQVSPWLFHNDVTFTQTPLGGLGPNDTLNIQQFGSNGKFNATTSPIGSWLLEVTYTNINGCTGVSSDTIRVLETPNPPSPDSASYCEGEDIYLSATADIPDSLYWFNDANQDNLLGIGSPVYWGVAPNPALGPFYVWVTQNNGKCISEAVQYRIPIKQSPDASFTMTYRDSSGQVLYDVPNIYSPIYGYNPFGVSFSSTYATGNDSVWWNHHAEDGIDPSWVNDGNNWSAGFTYTVANMTEEGTVGLPFITQMIITNEFGCSDTAQVLIWNIGTENYYNVFTPNGDGINDVFYVSNTTLEFFKVEIFNRWGVKVYEWENDYTKGWDGGDQPEGVYFWVLTGSYVDGKEFKKQGTVTLTGRK